MAGKKRTTKSKARKGPYVKKAKEQAKVEEKADGYSFDICYWLDDPVGQKEYDEFFEEFGNKIEWYASDTGPFGTMQRKQRANGYLVKDPQVLLTVVTKTKEHSKFFIDFVHKNSDISIWSKAKPDETEGSLNDIEEEIRSILNSKDEETKS